LGAGDQLLRRALTDAETGLFNWISLRMETERAVARAERYHFPLGLVVVHCHRCGPDEMTLVAGRLAGALRRSDLLARTGERDLVLLLTHDDAENVHDVIERLRRLGEEIRATGVVPGLELEIRAEVATDDYGRLLAHV